MEIFFVGAAFIICGILLLISTSYKSKIPTGNDFSQTHKKSGLGRFVERVEKLKINRRNSIELEQLSSNQKLLLEQTYRKIKRIAAYVLIAIGFVFLIF